MGVKPQTIPLPQAELIQSQPEPIQSQRNIPRWNPALRIAFRFWMVYLGLYCLTTQVINTVMGLRIPDLAAVWPLRPMITWVGAHLFHVNASLTVFWGSGSASTDCMFGWVTIFCLLMTAIVATIVWSLLDRSRENYAELYKWFRFFIRFALAGQLIIYGMIKVFPVQMAYPSLIRLLQPLGTLSPMGVLWVSMGAAPVYEIITGCIEVTAGLLLIIPRTATLGTLVSLVAMIQVFLLDMTQDVPAKLLAFHLILFSCFLLAPDVSRLVRMLLLNRATAPSTQEKLFHSVRANRIALVAQIIVGLWILGAACQQSWGLWSKAGGGKPGPPLYGIWEVKQMSVDQQPRLPLLTDSSRWRRAIFDSARNCPVQYSQVMHTETPLCLVFQRLDDSFAPYGAAINLSDKTLALTKKGDKNWKTSFTFQRPAENQLILDGQMDNHQVHMELQLIDRNSFALVSRGFHWTQEAPFGRYYRDAER